MASSQILCLWALWSVSARVEREAPWLLWGALAGAWWVAYGLRAGRAEARILPVASLLFGLGWVEIWRLDPQLGFRQAIWGFVGLAVLCLCRFLPATHNWIRWRYHFFGWGLLLQASVALFGVEVNGARLWFRIGELQVQPVELVKILMILFLASFFARFRGFLKERREEGITALPARTVGVLGFSCAAALGVLVLQKDLGMALLLMGVFLGMFYVAVGHKRLIVSAVGLFAVAALVAYQMFGHVQTRVLAWLDPFSYFETGGYQMSQALFSLAWGGLTGTGLGAGEPFRIPEVATDFIYVALAEELGLLGGVLIVSLLVTLIAVVFERAIEAEDEFRGLVHTGVATMLACQTLIILCGTLKVIPMTGITLPFVSYGGSSLVSNFLLLGLVFMCLDEEADS